MDQQQPPAQPNVPASLSPEQDAQQNRDIAALSYVWILSLVVYFAKRDSSFVRFHARQGIVLFLLSIIVWLIPYVGRLLELIILALVVLGFLNAAQGQQKELPLIGALARRDLTGVRLSWREMIDAFARGWQQLRRRQAAQPTPSPPPPQLPPSTPTPPPHL